MVEGPCHLLAALCPQIRRFTMQETFSDSIHGAISETPSDLSVGAYPSNSDDPPTRSIFTMWRNSVVAAECLAQTYSAVGPAIVPKSGDIGHEKAHKMFNSTLPGIKHKLRRGFPVLGLEARKAQLLFATYSVQWRSMCA